MVYDEVRCLVTKDHNRRSSYTLAAKVQITSWPKNIYIYSAVYI